MSSLKDTIKDMLADGMKPKEIAEELGCSVQTVYNVKHQENKKKQAGEAKQLPKEEPEPEKPELTRKTRFPEEKDEEPEELEFYECGACGHTWRALSDEFQEYCPVCGVEFY